MTVRAKKNFLDFLSIIREYHGPAQVTADGTIYNGQVTFPQ